MHGEEEGVKRNAVDWRGTRALTAWDFKRGCSKNRRIVIHQYSGLTLGRSNPRCSTRLVILTRK